MAQYLCDQYICTERLMLMQHLHEVSCHWREKKMKDQRCTVQDWAVIGLIYGPILQIYKSKYCWNGVAKISYGVGGAAVSHQTIHWLLSGILSELLTG